MHVGNGLPGVVADVDADVIAVRLVLFVNHCFGPVHQRPKLGLFRIRGIKITGYMAVGNDQGMTGIHGIAVPTDKGQFTFDHDLVLDSLAEDAGRFAVGFRSHMLRFHSVRGLA